jgi:hypothetical protein
MRQKTGDNDRESGEFRGYSGEYYYTCTYLLLSPRWIIIGLISGKREREREEEREGQKHAIPVPGSSSSRIILTTSVPLLLPFSPLPEWTSPDHISFGASPGCAHRDPINVYVQVSILSTVGRGVDGG